ncbi:YccF family protein [Pseudovibrio brasiliensis]|uniref:Inner membrane protein YccF n=1 Tax=Pseudovibrio brasiliensis TaxID=1898042 RepID=A0ABX8AQ08_9HYPH|nr:YccF family protein [Pseudovibrio brasiliensis]QUS55786.1 YccF family protein [Pseudovibrio brasiliensis]
MRYAGNVIWFIFGGWLLALMWLLYGVLFAITIIGLPYTKAAIEMAKLSAWPFGKEVVHIRDLDNKEATTTTVLSGAFGFIFNILWFPFGLSLSLAYLIAGLLNCITLIGIPFGIQAFKLAGISLWPVGRRVVTTELAELVRQDKAKATLESYRA